MFYERFDHEGYFQSKMEKVKITTEFCIFELVVGTNFRSNGWFSIFASKMVYHI